MNTLRKLLPVTDIIAFLILWGLAFAIGERNSIWIVGLGIAAIGFVLWMVARRQLGASFSIGAEARQLVTGGLYGKFRHPIYFFGAIANGGALIGLQNWWLLALWIGYLVPIQWLRLRREEEILEEAFGNAFLRHRRQTWI